MAGDHAISDVLRVGVNLLWLRPGEVGGTESYIRRVLHAVSAQVPFSDGGPSRVEWHLFGTPEAINSVRPAHSAVVEHHAPVGFVDPLRRNVLERTWLRWAMKSGLDVIHHAGGTVPFRSNTPTVVTIHDLQPLDDPQNFSLVKRTFLASAIPDAISRANLVVAPSDWVRDAVRDRFDVRESSVRTVSAYADVPAAVAVEFDPPKSSSYSSTVVEAGPFALYPAMTMRHKNHRVLFRAFSVAQKVRPDLQLVCVGAVGRHHEEIVAAARAMSPRIHVLGHVPLDDLRLFMRRAEIVVFPSRYEGFGLPVLEAQQLGVPVVASSAGALPEVAGPDALLVSPDDVDGWAEVLSSPLAAQRRQDVIRSGRANAGRYSIENTATQQWGAYTHVTQ